MQTPHLRHRRSHSVSASQAPVNEDIPSKTNCRPRITPTHQQNHRVRQEALRCSDPSWAHPRDPLAIRGLHEFAVSSFAACSLVCCLPGIRDALSILSTFAPTAGATTVTTTVVRAGERKSGKKNV
jgi:hypothetical protein